MQLSDIARQINVSDVAISPDGGTVAFVVTRTDLEAGTYRSAVWVAAADGSTLPLQLTAGDDHDGGPAWSADGRRLAFSRSPAVPKPGERPKHSLHVAPVNGPGEVVTVATADEAFTGVTWSPHGSRVAYAQRVRDERYKPDEDRLRPPRRIDGLQVRLDSVGWTVDRRKHVFVSGVDGTDPPRQISDGPYEHGAPVWSPDGHWLACSAARHEGWDIDLAVDIWRFAVDGAEPPRRLTKTDAAYAWPSWSPDGSKLATLAGDNRSFRHSQVAVLDVATGDVKVLTTGLDRQCAPYPGQRAPIWVEGGTALLFAIEDHGRVPVMRVAADGSGPPADVVAGNRWITGYDEAGGSLAFTAATATVPPELFSWVAGQERQLTALQDAFLRASPAVAPERIDVPSPAGDGDIDAWIMRPPGFDAAQRYPMLLQIHGGPMTQHGERWFDEAQLYASAGYVVVYANPHGSTGATDAWVRAIRSPLAKEDPGTGWGGIDHDDLMAVVDAALEREPAIDPARLGVLGGSYGGYMASWIIGHTDRFAAACSERSVNNLLTEEWTSDFAGTFRHELGVDPFDQSDEYLRMSPITYVQSIDTPVLILHSEEDLRCAVEQADQLFVMLRLLGKPVEYWRFPAESHELSRSGSPVHRVQRAEIILEWFDRFLKPGRPND
jgi:dipeptidyl aminopeptidase/acylaminoacyl peptidase